MKDRTGGRVSALIVALPETAGSALYGMVDVLGAAGTLWSELVGEKPAGPLFETRIVSLSKAPFECGNAIPVKPQCAIADSGRANVVILPELWIAPNDNMKGRYPELAQWVRSQYIAGSSIYSACTGAILLASTGLLDGRQATSHWAYEDLFRTSYPDVRFNPEPSLCFADNSGRIVTAGGTTSWHDLALHIISRHCGPEEALRIAKVYLLKWHAEGQLPFARLVRRQPHADSAVRQAEDYLAENYLQPHAVSAAVNRSRIPERSLKRRFKDATGLTMIDYVQNLRIEEAKRLLEETSISSEEVASLAGYENPAFFRRIFRRATGLTPANYRRMFKPLVCGEIAKAPPQEAAPA